MVKLDYFKAIFFRNSFVLMLLITASSSLLCPAHLQAKEASEVVSTQRRIKVKGQIVDEQTGTKLEGVSVQVGGSIVSVSKKEGTFEVQMTRGSSITFSIVGYEPVTRSFSEAQNFVLIKLKPVDTEIEEVVVTALGIEREKRALGYAATVLDGEQLTGALSGNWTDALSGKVAGLDMIRSGSGPTGSNKIVLRGAKNLVDAEDDEALIVVDGVIMNGGSGRRTAVSDESVYATGSENLPADYGGSINDINPEDIEHITVLKGAGASALYGQRGANGAIIITTKSGRAGARGWGITVNSNTSFEDINRWPDLQFEYGQGLDGADYYSFLGTEDGGSTRSTSSAYGPRFEGQYFYQYNPVTHTRNDVRTLWQPYPNKIREFFDVGRTFTNSISINGGSESTTARFSATNVKNHWIMPNTGYDRNSLALSVNTKVNNKLRVSSKINYNVKSSDNLPSVGYGNQSIMYWYIFWQPSADIDWLKDYWAPGKEQREIKFPFSSYPENPYAISYEFLNQSNRQTVTGNVAANYNFSKALNLQVRTAIDYGYEQRAQKRPYDAGRKFDRGSYRTQNIYSQELNADFLLNYKKKLNADFDISGSVGGNTMRNSYVKDELRADALVYPGVYTMANAAVAIETVPYRSIYEINSLYALASAGYKDYLYLDATSRQDWNSTLATPGRKGGAGLNYWSVNASFIASSVFKLPTEFNYVKLRASYATVGSGGNKPYRTEFNYQPAASTFSGGLLNPAVINNPDLKPLRTNTYESGLELQMFKKRLNIDLTHYVGSTFDQILERIIDRSSGGARQLVNAGKVRNSGIELAVNGTVIQKKDGFGWKMYGTFSNNRNKIVDILDSTMVLQTGAVGGAQLIAKVGGTMGDMYGRGYLRAPDGQIVYDPSSGVALLNQDDVVYLGNTTPKWRGSFGSDFTYRNFRLNVLFDAQMGAVAHSLMHYKLAEQGKTTNTLPGRYNGIVGNGVIDNGDGTYRKNDVIAHDIDEYYRSHYGIDNAEGSTLSTDFLKFREARFDYSLPQHLITRLGLQRTTIGVYGRNLFVWSPWPMFDPEFGTLSGTDIVRGFETAQFPSTRTFGFNLVVGF